MLSKRKSSLTWFLEMSLFKGMILFLMKKAKNNCLATLFWFFWLSNVFQPYIYSYGLIIEGKQKYSDIAWELKEGIKKKLGMISYNNISGYTNFSIMSLQATEAFQNNFH